MHVTNQAKVNYNIFRDCVGDPIIQKSGAYNTNSKQKRTKPRRESLQQHGPQPSNAQETDPATDGEDLADFIDYIATELFTSLPTNLQTISYADFRNNPALATSYNCSIPPNTLQSLLSTVPPPVTDSLETYSLTTNNDLPTFLGPIFTNYISSATAPPPPNNPTLRATACEICHRDWIPLTYHHLIPRQVHAKAIKRGWHEEWRLDSVAWLCRACHSFVHKVATNEELAREWWSVERLIGREDVQGWARWVGRVRWKSR